MLLDVIHIRTGQNVGAAHLNELQDVFENWIANHYHKANFTPDLQSYGAANPTDPSSNRRGESDEFFGNVVQYIHEYLGGITPDGLNSVGQHTSLGDETLGNGHFATIEAKAIKPENILLSEGDPNNPDNQTVLDHIRDTSIHYRSGLFVSPIITENDLTGGLGNSTLNVIDSIYYMNNYYDILYDGFGTYQPLFKNFRSNGRFHPILYEERIFMFTNNVVVPYDIVRSDPDTMGVVANRLNEKDPLDVLVYGNKISGVDPNGLPASTGKAYVRGGEEAVEPSYGRNLYAYNRVKDYKATELIDRKRRMGPGYIPRRGLVSMQ